jgi:NAD(P)-dependent dehydrogenase (short-subunit alcohol dehydrogenase family)
MRLDGKRVLITGTGGGQGGTAQELFASEGARIVGCDLQEGTAERTAAALRHQGHDVHGYTVDLTDASSTERWIEQAASNLGGIDVLYNNAAGYGFAPFAEMDLKLWRQVMSDELDILFHTTQPAWKYLIEGGGSVINTASLSALRGIAPGARSPMRRLRVEWCHSRLRSQPREQPMGSGQTPFHPDSSRRPRPTPPWMMGSEPS